MGGFQTVLTALPTVIKGAEIVAQHRQDRRDRAQAQEQLAQRQTLEQAQAQTAAAQEQARISLQAQDAEAQRQSALRRAVARQRANFGGQGVSAGSGSAQAVLLGFFEESEEERARRERMDALRLRVLDDESGARRASNVLQRTQLQERNRVDAIAGRNTALFQAGRLLI